MFGKIYLITNIITNKRYVGQTILTLSSRWSRHVWSVNHRAEGYLHRSIAKYGTAAFTIRLLQEADTREELDAAESAWIQALGTIAPAGYNCTSGGESPRHTEHTKLVISAKNRGTKRTDAAKEKMSCAQRKRFASNPAERRRLREFLESVRPKTRKHSEATKEKIRVALKGRTVAPEVAIKHGNAWRGKKRSVATRLAMSLAAKARWASA